MEKSIVKANENLDIIEEESGCTKYLFHNPENADFAEINCFELFPGVSVFFNEVRLFCFQDNFEKEIDAIEIEHCRDGRFEFDFENEVVYLSKGDMAIHDCNHRNFNSVFPSKYYSGLTIIIYPELFEQNVSKIFKSDNIDAYKIRELFCSKRFFTVFHGNENLNHIFSEMYNLPENIKLDYLRLKVIELVLFLGAMDYKELKNEKQKILGKNLIKNVKEVHDFLQKHLDERYTIDFLCQKFSFSKTLLKESFRLIYNEPIYTYQKKLRLQKAANLLLMTDKSVVDIACDIGYENPSKFSYAFKKLFGKTPNEYRK